MPAGGGAVFTFAPASCTLLFPYAAFSMGWNTGIAIANPSNKAGGTPLSGSLTFTLFPNDEDMVEYSTDGMSPGVGLDPDGFLPAGNTYIVLLNEILDSAGFSGDFLGHIYVDTDFTGCRGLGYVSDFKSGAQAYLPYFGDNLDEGCPCPCQQVGGSRSDNPEGTGHFGLCPLCLFREPCACRLSSVYRGLPPPRSSQSFSWGLFPPGRLGLSLPKEPRLTARPFLI